LIFRRGKWQSRNSLIKGTLLKELQIKAGYIKSRKPVEANATTGFPLSTTD
jgi:hypothetical protein